MRDIRDLPTITDAMLRRGHSELRIRKLPGGNPIRVFPVWIAPMFCWRAQFFPGYQMAASI